MTGPAVELAVSNSARNRWPDEPEETYEPVGRDRDGLFDDREFALILALLLRRGLAHEDAVDLAAELLAALTGRR